MTSKTHSESCNPVEEFVYLWNEGSLYGELQFLIFESSVKHKELETLLLLYTHPLHFEAHQVFT